MHPGNTALGNESLLDRETGRGGVLRSQSEDRRLTAGITN